MASSNVVTTSHNSNEALQKVAREEVVDQPMVDIPLFTTPANLGAKVAKDRDEHARKEHETFLNKSIEADQAVSGNRPLSPALRQWRMHYLLFSLLFYFMPTVLCCLLMPILPLPQYMAHWPREERIASFAYRYQAMPMLLTVAVAFMTLVTYPVMLHFLTILKHIQFQEGAAVSSLGRRQWQHAILSLLLCGVFAGHWVYCIYGAPYLPYSLWSPGDVSEVDRAFLIRWVFAAAGFFLTLLQTGLYLHHLIHAMAVGKGRHNGVTMVAWRRKNADDRAQLRRTATRESLQYWKSQNAGILPLYHPVSSTLENPVHAAEAPSLLGQPSTRRNSRTPAPISLPLTAEAIPFREVNVTPEEESEE